jgi:MFS family permease
LAAGKVQEWRHGWLTLLGSVVGMSGGLGIFGSTNSFFIKPLHEAFGWTRGEISLTSVSILVLSFLMPVVGRLVDRHGPHFFILVGGVTFTAVYVALAFMPGELWYYFAILAVVGLIAGPATAPLVFTRPIVAAFERSRGLALAIGMSGGVLTSIVLLPVLQHIIATSGWRSGYLFLAPIVFVFALSSYLMLRRAHRVSAKPASDAAAPEAAAGHTMLGALRDARFYLLAVAMMLSVMAATSFSSQQQALLSDIGVPGPIAALMGAGFAVCVVVGRLGCGVLLDRLWAPGVAAIALGAPALGLLAFLTPDPPLWLLISAGAFIGLSQGAEADMLAFFTARYFGLRSFGAIFGVLGLCFGVAAAIGGVSAGFLFDRTGDYHFGLKLAAAMAALAGAAILMSGLLRGKSEAKARVADIEATAAIQPSMTEI